MIVYALKSALCLSLLYVPYMLLLCRESFFRFNRFLLLGIMLLSALLPLFDIHLLSWRGMSLADSLTAVVEVGMPVAVEEGRGVEPAAGTMHSSWSFGLLLSVGYLAGAVAQSSGMAHGIQLVALSAFATSENELMPDNGPAVVEASSKATDFCELSKRNLKKPFLLSQKLFLPSLLPLMPLLLLPLFLMAMIR